MGKIKRHMQVESTRLADGALDTVDIKDASVTAAKLSEKFEHGTVSGVTATGRYKTFTTAFGGVPDVFVQETTTSLAARVVGTAAAGSFQVNTTATGTVDVMFQAWGVR